MYCHIYNLLKIDKPNHRRGRDKGHITRAKRMWQSNRRPSQREREESTQRSAKKKDLGRDQQRIQRSLLRNRARQPLARRHGWNVIKGSQTVTFGRGGKAIYYFQS